MGAACTYFSNFMTLYRRLDGEQSFPTIVSIFYERVMLDERISWMFEDVDWKIQKDHVTWFLTAACGGPDKYTGETLRAAHAHVNNGKFPEEVHFDAVMENLNWTLKKLYMPQRDIDEVEKVLLSVKDDILGLENDDKELLEMGNFDSRKTTKPREYKKGELRIKPVSCVKQDFANQNIDPLQGGFSSKEQLTFPIMSPYKDPAKDQAIVCWVDKAERQECSSLIVSLQKDKQISMKADISGKKKNPSSTSTKKPILEDDKISSEIDAAKGLRSSSTGIVLSNSTLTSLKVRNYSSGDERVTH